MDILHIERLLCYRRHFLCGLELHERSNWSFSDTTLCVYTASPYSAIWCTTTRDNKTHVPYDCTLVTKRWLYCQWCIIFIRTKLASYTTCCSVFSINRVHANIKTKGKNFFQKLTTSRDGPVKSTEARHGWNTRRLTCYRKIVVKKD